MPKVKVVRSETPPEREPQHTANQLTLIGEESLGRATLVCWILLRGQRIGASNCCVHDAHEH